MILAILGLARRIRSNEDTNEVWKIRRIETRRGAPPLDFHVAFFEPFDVADRLEYGVMRPSGSFESIGSKQS